MTTITANPSTAPLYEFRICTAKRNDWRIFAQAIKGLEYAASRDRLSGILVIRSASPVTRRRIHQARTATNVPMLETEAGRVPLTDQILNELHDCHLRAIAHDDDEL